LGISKNTEQIFGTATQQKGYKPEGELLDLDALCTHVQAFNGSCHCTALATRWWPIPVLA